MSGQTKTARVILLGAMVPGSRGTIVAYDGGRGMAGRLADLGILPGTPVEMVSNLDRGPVLIEVRGCRYTLGRGIAEKIRVRA